MLPFYERFRAFLGRMLSVTLGIVITFSVQGILDRQRDKRAIRSALELVQTELASNLDDIGILSDYFRQEQASAQYLTAHKKDLAKCPADSVNFHIGYVNADVSVAFSHDALELLKMSSMFPKIRDNDLSMKIIRAYNTCELMVSNINRHVSARDSYAESTVARAEANKRTVFPAASPERMRASATGAAEWLITRQDDFTWITDPTDIQEALDAIDSFLKY